MGCGGETGSGQGGRSGAAGASVALGQFDLSGRGGAGLTTCNGAEGTHYSL